MSGCTAEGYAESGLDARLSQRAGMSLDDASLPRRPGRPSKTRRCLSVGERYVIFKGGDMPDELDEDVGPVIVVHSDEPQNYAERGWMSRSQAKQVAAELGYALEIDGPSDEELEQLRSGDEPDDHEVPF
jgi:hypothetical protein